MAKRILGLKDKQLYKGRELGLKLNEWFYKEGIPHRKYEKGYLVTIAREHGLEPPYYGSDIIPIIKAEIERVKNKAKTTSKQTPPKAQKTTKSEPTPIISEEDELLFDIVRNLLGEKALEWLIAKRIKEN